MGSGLVVNLPVLACVKICSGIVFYRLRKGNILGDCLGDYDVLNSDILLTLHSERWLLFF